MCDGPSEPERLPDVGGEVTPQGPTSAFVCHTPPTALLLELLDASRLPGKLGKGAAQKLPPPQAPGGRAGGEGQVPSGRGGVRTWSQHPLLCPSLAVSECHVSAVSCRPPQFHGATSSYPRGPFHFLDVKATCSFKTTSLAPFLPHAEGGAGVWSARSSSPLWLTRGRLWSFLARAGRTFMPVLTEGLWCAQHRTWAVMGGLQGVQSARGHRAVTSAQGGRGRRYRMRANSML